MSSNGIAGLFRVNRSVTNPGDGAKQFRLPLMRVFPKFSPEKGQAGLTAQPLRSHESVVLGGQNGVLPEMASDVLGLDAGYALENVRRERGEVRPWSKAGWRHLVERVLGGGGSSKARF